MPAIISHWLFGKKLAPLAAQRADVADFRENCFLWGSQGPDVLFFQRLVPWCRGQVVRKYGSMIHDGSPSEFFTELADVLDACPHADYDAILSYALGMCCHYAFDCAAHPYVNWLTDVMSVRDSRGKDFHYHGEIESMLDIMLLRNETGMLPTEVRLTECIPADPEVDRILADVWTRILGSLYDVTLEPKYADLLGADMRECFSVLSDRHALRRPIFNTLERAVRKNDAPVSAFMRPMTESLRWDYGNVRHQEWCNPLAPDEKSTESIYDIFARAAARAAEMMDFFMKTIRPATDSEGRCVAENRRLRLRRDFSEYTQERNFSDNFDAVGALERVRKLS